ncbi:MAG TPA: ABC transporter permease [Alphaproteobacteria bacterium]|nr:ABC transporter permease [Alphaproteobacteria bacterium]
MELTQPNAGRPDGVWRLLRGHTGVLFGLVLIAVMVGAALLAPWLFTGEVTTMDPINRLKAPSGDYWFGTDMYGRDLYTRTVYGARISLVVGLCVMGLSLTIGLFIGLLSGYLRLLDAVIMRIMDGLMAIPGILLAIAMIALAGASLTTVVLAITIPEIPRVVRLVRSVVLTIREEPYVEAALTAGTRLPKMLLRHILPNTVAPLIVQGTYVCASAIITEALLSFLGAGIPPETPTWGNIMAEGRALFQVSPWVIFFPGICLALTVLAINVLGDGLRDTLDPRIARRM